MWGSGHKYKVAPLLINNTNEKKPDTGGKKNDSNSKKTDPKASSGATPESVRSPRPDPTKQQAFTFNLAEEPAKLVVPKRMVKHGATTAAAAPAAVTTSKYTAR